METSVTIGRAVDFSELVRSSVRDFAGRGWLLDRFRRFIKEEDGPRILVVLGDPGAGKSAALARLVDERPSPHFFFGRTDGLAASEGGGWSEPVRCAETLVTQLQTSFGEGVFDARRWGIDIDLTIHEAGEFEGAQVGRFIARPRSGPTIRMTGSVGLRDVTSVPAGLVIHELRLDPMLALQELVVAPLRNAAGVSADPIVVVLDGLDEWDRLSCPMDLLEILSMADLPSNVRIVASARPSYAERLTAECITVDISAEAQQSNTDDDVGNLVDHVAAERRLALDQEMRAKVIRRAAGNFLFATYALRSLDPSRLAESIAHLPRGLEELYLRDLLKVVDSLKREGATGSLGPMLSALCAAREPISAELIGRAAQISPDIAVDLLGRLRSFIRPVQHGGETRYSPYHLSFSDAVLSGRGGLGIGAAAGHRRLVKALTPANPRQWTDAGDYAVKHIGVHAALAGPDAKALTEALLDDAAYLVERVERMGAEALSGDLVYASAVGCAETGLAAIVAELSLRADLQRASGVSAAQALAVVAGAVGNSIRAIAFAELAPERLVATPAWSAGAEGARLAAGGFRSPGKTYDAAISADGLMSLVKARHVEIWNVRDRILVAMLEVDARLAMIQANGGAVWVACGAGAGDEVLRRYSLPEGSASAELSFDHKIRAIRVSDDGNHVAVGTDAGRVLLISTDDAATIARAEVGGSIASIRFEGGSVIVLTQGRKLSAWRLPELSLEAFAYLPVEGRRPDFIDRTFGLAVAGDFAAIGCVDGTVTRVEIEDDGSQQSIGELDGWADQLGMVGSHVLAGDSTGRLHFLDPTARRDKVSFRAHAAAVALVAPHPEPPLAVSVSEDGDVAFWSEPQAEAIGAPGHSAAVADVGFGDRDELMSVGSDGSLLLWSKTGEIADQVHIDPEAFTGMRLTRDLSSVVLDQDHVLRRTRLNEPGDLPTSPTAFRRPIIDKCQSTFTPPPTFISVSDSANLGTRNGSDGLELWDLDAGTVLHREHRGSSSSRVGLSHDGSFLLLEREGRLWMRDLGGGGDLRPIPEGDQLLLPPFWTRLGRRLVAFAAGEILVICADTLVVQSRWSLGSASPTFALASPIGDTLIIFSRDGSILLCSLEGARVGGLVLRPGATAAALSRDGRKLAVGDAGGGVHLFQLVDGAE